jgi:hypothetical protein
MICMNIAATVSARLEMARSYAKKKHDLRFLQVQSILRIL